MSKYDLKYHKKPRRSLDESLAGPVLRLLAALLAAVLAISLLVFIVIPALVRLFGGTLTRQDAAIESTPSPSPTAAPTPEPVWAGEAVSIDSKALGGLPMLDPSIYGGRILYVTGTDASAPDRLYAYDISTGVSRQLAAKRENGTLRNPVENADYLLYEDVSPEGAGSLYLRDRKTGADTQLLSLRYGAPRLFLSNNYLCYAARTGADTSELYLVDLISRAGLAVARFYGAAYGASLPNLSGMVLTYAEASADGRSALVSIKPSSSEKTSVEIDGLVHDPKRGSGFTAYLNSAHGETAQLVLLKDGEAPRPIASNVADFFVSGAYIVYQSGGEVHACHADSGAVFTLSGGGGSSRLLTAGGGYALWQTGSYYQLMRLEHADGEG